MRRKTLVLSELRCPLAPLDPAPVVMRPPRSSVRFCWPGTGVSCILELFIHTSLCQVIVPIKGCNSVLPRCGECAVVVFLGCFCFLICGGKETSLHSSHSILQTSESMEFWFVCVTGFLMWTVLKVFIEFLAILFLFVFLGGGGVAPRACGMLTPQPGIKPAPPAWEGEALTTGPPGECPGLRFLWFFV